MFNSERPAFCKGTGHSFANVVHLQPPLMLSAAEADRVCDVVSDTVAKVAGTKK
jgi:hypothetical protein